MSDFAAVSPDFAAASFPPVPLSLSPLLDVAYALVAKREGVSDEAEVLLWRERGEKRTSAEGRDRADKDVGPVRKAGRSTRSDSERFMA